MAEKRKVLAWGDKSTWPTNCTDFLQEYTHMRGYHGCRPASVEPYYANGFLPPTENDMLMRTLEILSGNGISDKQLIAAFHEHWDGYSEDGVNFTLSKREQLVNCGHYMIYGSELICGIGRRFGLDLVIKAYGIPTMFTVDVPLERVCFTSGDIDLLASYLKEHTDCDKPPAVNYGFLANGKIEPNLIVTHEHPKKIHDPFNWGTYYTAASK